MRSVIAILVGAAAVGVYLGQTRSGVLSPQASTPALLDAAMLVAIAVFFAAKDGETVNPTNAQREELMCWFWRSCFTRRYSSGVLRNLNRDIDEMRKLRVTGNQALASITAALEDRWFIENQFNVATVNTKTFVLMLAQAQPLSLVSGTPVDLSYVLQNYNRSEFHHLMPQGFLRGIGVADPAISQLANFAFISSADNKILGGVAPSQYRAKMPAAKVDEILKHALTPPSLFTDDYDMFRAERAVELADFGKKLASL